MIWVIEQPLYLIILGLVAVVGFGFGWMQTGYRALLYLAVGSAICAGGLLLLERLVVTDAEEVESVLHQIAGDIERNDLPAVLAAIHPDAVQTRQRAEAEFPNYEIDYVDIKSNLKVDVDDDAVPPKAMATFNVMVKGRERSFGPFTVPRFVEVTLVKVDDRWLALDYRHYEVTFGMKKRP